MIIGALHWYRSSDRSPAEVSDKSYLYLCYDERIHHWWIGSYVFEGQRNSDGDRMKPGWAGGGGAPTHWAKLPTPSDSENRPLAREERRK